MRFIIWFCYINFFSSCLNGGGSLIYLSFLMASVVSILAFEIEKFASKSVFGLSAIMEILFLKQSTALVVALDCPSIWSLVPSTDFGLGPKRSDAF